MGRFISADAFTTTGQGLLGNNMFAYCNNNIINSLDPLGKYAVSISIGFDTTFTYFGVSETYGLSFDDKGNIAFQASYSAPSYASNGEVYHTGLADIGIAASLQFTTDETVYDLEGPSCYAGASAGSGGFLGFDLVYSGVKAIDTTQREKQANGFSVSTGVGVGADLHFKQTQTITLWSFNIFDILGVIIGG